MKGEDTVEAALEADITIEALIISLVSKHQGITIKEVEVVVIIIIGILGITTEIIEAEDGSTITEVGDQEDVSVAVDTETIEIEGNFFFI